MTVIVKVTITGLQEALTAVGKMGEAARYLVNNPVAIGPTVNYGLYQEVRRGYMAAGAQAVSRSAGPAISAAIPLGPEKMAQTIEKLARDVQAVAVPAAPIKTGALRGSIGVFYGSVGTSSGRGGTTSSRMSNSGSGRRRR